jgi:hypothetical protein
MTIIYRSKNAMEWECNLSIQHAGEVTLNILCNKCVAQCEYKCTAKWAEFSDDADDVIVSTLFSPPFVSVSVSVSHPGIWRCKISFSYSLHVLLFSFLLYFSINIKFKFISIFIFLSVSFFADLCMQINLRKMREIILLNN